MYITASWTLFYSCVTGKIMTLSSDKLIILVSFKCHSWKRFNFKMIHTCHFLQKITLNQSYTQLLNYLPRLLSNLGWLKWSTYMFANRPADSWQNLLHVQTSKFATKCWRLQMSKVASRAAVGTHFATRVPAYQYPLNIKIPV